MWTHTEQYVHTKTWTHQHTITMCHDQEHPDGTGKGITIGEAMRNLTISPP